VHMSVIAVDREIYLSISFSDRISARRLIPKSYCITIKRNHASTNLCSPLAVYSISATSLALSIATIYNCQYMVGSYKFSNLPVII